MFLELFHLAHEDGGVGAVSGVYSFLAKVFDSQRNVMLDLGRNSSEGNPGLTLNSQLKNLS